MNNNRLTSKDIKLMAAVTAIYLLVALINLGSFTAPQTGWEPDKLNETFIVDFGREVELDKIMVYGGLGHAWGCFGSLEIEAWQNGEYVPYTFVDVKSIFKWHYSTDQVKTDKLRFKATFLRTDNEADKNRFYKAEYREIGFFSGETLITGFVADNSEATYLMFDEQALVPERPNVLNSTYFDEIYFPRTALEQMEQRDVLYENTHPPLGKTLLTYGISLFGMTPFGWRIMGTLFGAAMLPLMHLIGKRLFKSSFWALFCTVLFAFDFMHFAQTRLATIDSYTVFFIMAMYYFMLRYYDTPSYERGVLKSFIPLLLSGIMLGLGGASKWIGFYGVTGLAVLFFMSRGYDYSSYNNQLNRKIKDGSLEPSRKAHHLTSYLGKYFYLTCLCCIVFFIAIPLAIYVLSFLPIHYNQGDKGLIKQVLDSIKSMFDYHKGVTSPHPYSSPWYEWPLSLRPIFYFQGSLLPEGMGAAIASFGNPLVWWTGLISLFLIAGHAISRLLKKVRLTLEESETAKLVWFPIIGYFSFYIPWIVAPRKLTFIYHYFACVPFLILMIGFVFRYLEEKGIFTRRTTLIFLGLTGLLFVIYYPLLSGIEVPRVYLNILQLLPRWEW